MEENVVKFQEKLKNLVALAKKKKNILEIQEINDVFRDMELEPTQMDKVFSFHLIFTDYTYKIQKNQVADLYILHIWNRFSDV